MGAHQCHWQLTQHVGAERTTIEPSSKQDQAQEKCELRDGALELLSEVNQPPQEQGSSRKHDTDHNGEHVITQGSLWVAPARRSHDQLPAQLSYTRTATAPLTLNVAIIVGPPMKAPMKGPKRGGKVHHSTTSPVKGSNLLPY